VSKVAKDCDRSARHCSEPGVEFYKRLEFFYQNVRGLRTKQFELLDNVYTMHSDVFCLTETWLNYHCCDRNLYPDNFYFFRSDRASSSKSRRGGVLIAVSSKFRACKRRYDLQFYDNCVWVEIPTQNGSSLLSGNHYFSRH
jgi:exonuclease III